ncbi:hypothetical protein A2Z22_03225 [Candidatus Woesebacteria bacterium RBG_16_34_12]|uniref:Uncharacterized protein n=1 Tax=Candidatus Woesebacteria bacterium RBG_16_34_12 TaxID=1802480 RepID=A0A1F7XBE3_9BACT|nr:MAG: hypothetical protein A2Z22_03225 [Candidatus Woesebacteria bacterium RBG_16_34_12]
MDTKQLRDLLKTFIQENKFFILIFLIGLFLRVYKLSSFFQFSHEQDLQAWIVKDILVDHHPRLIGQETSITGFFIGPLYYYMLIPFFFLFNMDPRASIIPITFISLATIVSVYYIYTKLFGKKVGEIGSFIYAISPAIVFLDRWAVPTQPTLLWSIWFYYCLIQFARGNFKPIPILIVLIGLIWHIHVAFVPLLLLVPIALFLGKRGIVIGLKNINRKSLILSLIIFLVLLIPFVAFEFRHNFQQVKGFLGVNDFSLGQAKELREGYYKVEVITEYINRVVWSPLFNQVNPKNPTLVKIPIMLFVFLGLVYFLSYKKLIPKNETVLLYLWFVIVFLGQMISKRIISDYYFNNLITLSLMVFSLVFYQVYLSKSGKRLILIIGIAFLLLGISKVVFKDTSIQEFANRKDVVEFIVEDMKKNGYQCSGINFIGDISVRYGYRYLTLWKGVNQITPGDSVPVYSIVQPFSISESEVVFISGNIGVILPQDPQTPDQSICYDPERQLLPLNGFVN